MVAEMPIRVGESGKNKGATVAWMSGTGNKGRGYRSEVIVPSGLKTEATVASDSVIRTKDSGYRSNVHCGGTRDIAAVWANTAEDD